MSHIRSYYYDYQLKRYLVQFMAIFAGMQVEFGATETREAALVKVPITVGNKDRVVAAIKAENTQNKPVRLPIMSVYMSNIDLAPERRKGVGQSRREVFMPTGGMFPDDFKTIRQRMPVPYNATFDLHIFTSNTEQKMQIIEQILMIFDPMVQIQTSDDVFDWTKITQVELTNIGFEENFPTGTDRRIIQTTLTFALPLWISVPADVRNDFIRDIFLRVGAVSTDSVTNQQMIADLDAQGVPYEEIFTLEDIDIGEDAE